MAGRASIALACATLCVAVVTPALGVATADRRAAERAARWLASNSAGAPAGQQADAIVALRLAGRSRASLRPRLSALSGIAGSYATTAGGAGKVVMAAVATGADPRHLAGIDYVRRITTRYAAGRYGSTAFDQALAMLALSSAGDPVPTAAARATLRARGPGGWSFDLSTSGRDSVDTTALVIEALVAAGVPPTNGGLRAAAAWMTAQAAPGGGFASAGNGGAAEADSTAGAVRALRALGRTPPARTRAALRALQDPDGGVRFTREVAGSRLIATTDALLALAGASLPPR